MTEQLPSDFLPFGHVVGRVIRAVGDTDADPDSDPEAIPVTGKGMVRFTPLELTRVVTGTVPSTWVQQETIAADLDSEGFLALSGARGLLLWPGAWKVSAGSSSAFSFPTFTIEVTSAHTADSPLDLWTAAPYRPPSGATVTTLVVPAGAAAGQVLAWDGSQLVWQDAGSGGGSGSQGPQGPQGVSVVSITDTDGDGIATVTLHDPATGADSTSALPLPRGTDGVSPATPVFTASATTLAAGSAATAAVTGIYPNLTLALGIPRGADGTGGGGSSLQIVGAGRPDITASMDATTQAAVASATVGTTFISTDGPQGAWAWQKTSSGWTVTVGDTKWRDVSSLINTGKFTGGTWRIKRALGTVTINATGLSRATAGFANNFLTLPSGLCGPGRRIGITTVFNDTSVYGAAWANSAANAIEGNFPAANGAFLMTFPTDDQWPATLPGNPTS